MMMMIRITTMMMIMMKPRLLMLMGLMRITLVLMNFILMLTIIMLGLMRITTTTRGWLSFCTNVQKSCVNADFVVVVSFRVVIVYSCQSCCFSCCSFFLGNAKCCLLCWSSDCLYFKR